MIKILSDSVIVISGDDFHNHNLLEGDYAYHRRIKQIGIVKNYNPNLAQWDFVVGDITTKRDSYKLFKLLYRFKCK